MNYYYFIRHRYQHYSKQLYCYCIYFVQTIIFLIASMLVRETILTFLIVVFSWGWLSWTFVEYIMHRFWMHRKAGVDGKKDFLNHQYHHTHPTDIKIKPLHRFFKLVVLLLLITLAIQWQNYFSFLAGFYAGFVTYTFMHVVLHKKWAAKVFKRLNEYHIYHHCKYPNRCFGISTVIWDVLFGTTPPKGAKITDRVRNFYFGEHNH